MSTEPMSVKSTGNSAVAEATVQQLAVPEKKEALSAWELAPAVGVVFERALRHSFIDGNMITSSRYRWEGHHGGGFHHIAARVSEVHSVRILGIPVGLLSSTPFLEVKLDASHSGRAGYNAMAIVIRSTDPSLENRVGKIGADILQELRDHHLEGFAPRSGTIEFELVKKI